MKQLYCATSLIVIAAYLLLGRGHWFSEAEREAAIAMEAFQSFPVELGRANTAEWNVPGERYDDAHYELSLAIDRIANLPVDRFKLKLRVQVAAFGRTEDGREIDRMIENWYWKGNRPFSPNSRTWESSGVKTKEFGLAEIVTSRFEQLKIVFTVLEPDARLNQGNPRLKLRRKADGAILHHMFVPRILRDGGMVLCVGLLIGLVLLAWKPRAKAT